MNYRKLMLSLVLCLPLSALAKQILVQSPHLSLVLNADEPAPRVLGRQLV